VRRDAGKELDLILTGARVIKGSYRFIWYHVGATFLIKLEGS
jgi:hypothetical protein